MNERLAQVGTQLKDALVKVQTAWKELEASRKRLILVLVLGLIAVVVGIVVILNVVGGRYVVLYEGMSQDESVQGLGVLETAGISARINDAGELEVPSDRIEAAMGQLALQGLPTTTLDYNILAQASGLTTTEFEKREAQKNQWQNRLQDTIKSLTGVQNAIVTLKIPNDTNRVWDPEAIKGSGSATIFMKPGYVLSPSQAMAIRHLIGPSVGIDPTEVTVMDGNGNLLAAAGEDYDVQAVVAAQFLERMGLEKEVEARMIQKAANLLSLKYPNTENWRISCTATLDFDAMVTEIKTYIPLEGTIHGVVDEEEIDAQMGPGQFSEGVVGETDNTDVPIYVDVDGDGQMDTVDYHRFRDYAVSYTLEQIEKDGPSLEGLTLSIVVDDSLSNETRQSLRQAISLGTGIPIENVGVESFLTAGTGEPEPPGTGGETLLGIPILFVYIAIGILLLLILILIFMMMMRSRAKKKKLVAAMADAEAEQAEADRIQQEIEERKKRLKDAAIGDQSENAITNEVREFARSNPEITANLLRNWLKEGE